jgi:hypothetical protein
VTSFGLYLEGWRSAGKPVEVKDFLRAFKWPGEYYQEMEDTRPLHDHRGTLHLNLAWAHAGDFGGNSTALRRHWRKELTRLARWLEIQATDTVSRATRSGLRLVIWVDVRSAFGQPAINLGASVVAAAARLRVPIRVVLHIGKES